MTITEVLKLEHHRNHRYLDSLCFFGYIFVQFLYSDEIKIGFRLALGNLRGRGTMKIQVGGLSDGVYQFNMAADSNSLQLDGHFPDQVVANITVEKSGTQIFLAARVSAEGSFECDRCLTPFTFPVKSLYRMYYVTDGAADSQVDPSELQIVPPGFSVIDLSEDVRQTMLLAVPLKLLCTENCKGLCPHCGTNLNSGTCTCTQLTVDSRWEQLSKLKKQI